MNVLSENVTNMYQSVNLVDHSMIPFIRVSDSHWNTEKVKKNSANSISKLSARIASPDYVAPKFVKLQTALNLFPVGQDDFPEIAL